MRMPGWPKSGLRHHPRFLSALGLVNLSLFAVYAVIFAVLLTSGLSRGADYTAFYTGWRVVLDGHGGQLYDPAIQAQVQRAILGGQSFDAGLNPFNNPPYSVLPFVPLGAFPFQGGFLVWSAIELALLAILIRLVLVEARPWRADERLAVAGWLLGFPALGIAFFQGSFSVLLALAMLAAYRALRSSQDGATGAWLVIASIKPQAVVGPAVATFVARRWRAVAVALVCGGLLAIAATLAFGLAIWPDYMGLLGTYTSTFDKFSVDPSVMWNLRGTLTLILGRGQASAINLISYAAFAGALVAIAFLWRGGWRGHEADGTGLPLSPDGPPGDRPEPPPSADSAIRFALTLVLTLLFSPHLNPHDDLLLVVAMVIAYPALRGDRLGWILATGASIAPLLILFGNGLRADAPTNLPVRIPTLLVAALACLLIAALVRLPRRLASRAATGPDPSVAGT